MVLEKVVGFHGINKHKVAGPETQSYVSNMQSRKIYFMSTSRRLMRPFAESVFASGGGAHQS